MQCRNRSTLELSLRNEQLTLHTTWARAVRDMVEQFLSELRKASVDCLVLPGFPGLSLSQGFWHSWVLGGRMPRQIVAHPPAHRTPAMSSPCAATSPMTTASSVSIVGTSLGYCQWPLWNQVSPGLAEGDCHRAEGRGR